MEEKKGREEMKGEGIRKRGIAKEGRQIGGERKCKKWV